MKVCIRKKGDHYSIYVAKKDLEEIVVDIIPEGGWGGQFTLSNGWILGVPSFDEEPALPKTMDVKLLSRG